MIHIKYFLTGLIGLIITAVIILGSAFLGYQLLLLIGGLLGISLATTIFNIAMLLIFIAMGIFFVAFIYIMGKDYWRQKRLDEIHTEYEKWRAEYYENLKKGGGVE